LHSYSPCMSKFASLEKAQRNRHDINRQVLEESMNGRSSLWRKREDHFSVRRD
jgi:hypothetical protein